MIVTRFFQIITRSGTFAAFFVDLHDLVLLSTPLAFDDLALGARFCTSGPFRYIDDIAPPLENIHGVDKRF